jgi:hypothetical protein
MSIAQYFPPLVGEPLRQWYQRNIEPSVNAAMRSGRIKLDTPQRSGLAWEVWSLFVAEAAQQGWNAVALTAERPALVQRYTSYVRRRIDAMVAEAATASWARIYSLPQNQRVRYGIR